MTNQHCMENCKELYCNAVTYLENYQLMSAVLYLILVFKFYNFFLVFNLENDRL
jgi:hypothetical protein